MPILEFNEATVRCRFSYWWKGELNNCLLEIDCWDSWNILDDGKGLERSQRIEVKAQHLQVNFGYDSFFRDLEARPDEWPDSSKPLWCGKGSDLVTDPSLGVDTIYIPLWCFLEDILMQFFVEIPRIADRLWVVFCSRNLQIVFLPPKHLQKWHVFSEIIYDWRGFGESRFQMSDKNSDMRLSGVLVLSLGHPDIVKSPVDVCFNSVNQTIATLVCHTLGKEVLSQIW